MAHALLMEFSSQLIVYLPPSLTPQKIKQYIL